MLLEVVITRKPSLLEQQQGKREELVLGPIAVMCESEAAGLIIAGAENHDKIGDPKTVSVQYTKKYN